LGRYHALEDEDRAIQRVIPAPQTDWQPGVQVKGQSVTTILGPLRSDAVGVGTQTARGNVESVLSYLVSLGPATEVGPSSAEAESGVA